MLSVIYKKIHGSINYIDYGTHLVTRPRSIHDFVILLGQNIGSRLCDNTRAVIYISAKKKIINYRWKYWTFTINCFLEHEWYLCPLTAVAYMCCMHVYCDIHLWWLYNTLENYKLHHPSNASNDNTRTMQKQLSNKFQAGTAKSAFFCAHTKCKL